MGIISKFNNQELIFMWYLLIINIISFFTFGIDKSKSEKDKWRIKESAMIILSALGGSSGSIIGMVIFKHKINKRKFYIGIPVIFLINKIVELFIFGCIK